MTEMAEVKETLNPKSAGLETCIPHDGHGEEPSQAWGIRMALGTAPGSENIDLKDPWHKHFPDQVLHLVSWAKDHLHFPRC